MAGLVKNETGVRNDVLLPDGVRQYILDHKLEKVVTDALNHVIQVMPGDPYACLAETLSKSCGAAPRLLALNLDASVPRSDLQFDVVVATRGVRIRIGTIVLAGALSTPVADEAAEGEDEAEAVDKAAQKAKARDFESKDLKTARQRAQPSAKKKDDEVKATPSSARWPEVKEVLESGDCGVDKGRQKKAIAVDRPKLESPYDSFDPVLLKCSFLTRVELKLPPGVLASDDFMLFFPGPLSESLVELILKENKLPSIPPGIKELKRIRSIDLSQNAITSLGDDDLWKSVATSLELLDLSFNQLDDVSALSPLVKLSQIKLDANKLTSLDGINWKELKQLSSLSAVGNELKELSTDIGEFAQSLEHLEVSENKLTALPPNLCELKKVKMLGVAGNPIKDQKALKAAEKGAKDLKTYLSKMKGKK